MTLAPAVQHSRKRTVTITWKDDDGAIINLTGSTITGIVDRNGTQASITGALTLATPTSGTFTWAYSAADVAQAGDFQVQFRAKYSADSLSEISYRTRWQVLPAFDFELVSASVSPSTSPSGSASSSASSSASRSASPSASPSPSA